MVDRTICVPVAKCGQAAVSYVRRSVIHGFCLGAGRGSCMPACMWSQVAEDESRHFSELLKRLRAIGSDYGALPVHDG